MLNMQVYLGGFDNEEQAALAYDIAAIKFRAHDANTNYPISNYEQELLHFDEVSLTSYCHSQPFLPPPLFFQLLQHCVWLLQHSLGLLKHILGLL